MKITSYIVLSTVVFFFLHRQVLSKLKKKNILTGYSLMIFTYEVLTLILLGTELIYK